jgi:oligopeptidase B
LNKKNTFTDFIACTKNLKKKYNFDQHQMIGKGGSAGGILIGAVANMAPDLFGGLILDRPAIDVSGFMANPKLPLTTGEYNEWGNLADPTYEAYIESYSPLSNIKKQNYPNLLLLNKYNDMHTPYWDIAEAAIKYRESALNNPLILIGTDFKAGHLGNANYQVEIAYQADIYAFVMYTITNGKTSSEND